MPKPYTKADYMRDVSVQKFQVKLRPTTSNDNGDFVLAVTSDDQRETLDAREVMDIICSVSGYDYVVKDMTADGDGIVMMGITYNQMLGSLLETNAEVTPSDMRDHKLVRAPGKPGPYILRFNINTDKLGNWLYSISLACAISALIIWFFQTLVAL